MRQRGTWDTRHGAGLRLYSWPVDLKRFIRDVPDFPEPGVLFRDITPLLQNAEAF